MTNYPEPNFHIPLLKSDEILTIGLVAEPLTRNLIQGTGLKIFHQT